MVSIEFGAAAREGEVVSCRPKGNSYELYIAFPNENKEDVRAAERFPVIQEVKIYAANSESPLEAMTGNLSSNGLGLETSTPLETGETIMAVSNCNEAFGVVRHCKQLDSGRFQTGVEVFHVMPKEASMSQGDSTKSELG